MDQLGWTLEDIGRLTFGIALPLREALRLCQLEAPENWRPSAYELISRPDLAKQIGGLAEVVENVSSSQFPLDALSDSLRILPGCRISSCSRIN